MFAVAHRPGLQKAVGIPTHAFTVSNRCDGHDGFMRAWSKTKWNMTCFDDRAMYRILNKYQIPVPTMAIHRADIARFLILYERGGLYVDSDVYPITNTQFSPESFLDPTGLVVGYEAIVTPEEQRRNGIYRAKSLCMWTLFAVPHSHILLTLAKKLTRNVQARRRGSKTLHEYIHKTTGPTAMTDFLLPSLQRVAPVLAFGCGQSHSGAFFCNPRVSFTRHYFAGSWRKARY